MAAGRRRLVSSDPPRRSFRFLTPDAAACDHMLQTSSRFHPTCALRHEQRMEREERRASPRPFRTPPVDIACQTSRTGPAARGPLVLRRAEVFSRVLRDAPSLPRPTW